MVGRKPEDWRILTPILSILSPLFVSILSYFISTSISEQKEFNRNVVNKMDAYIDTQRKDKNELDQKWASLRYQCCSEMSSVRDNI